ncbi:unnamed protein product [Schistosoma mattheei]|uniref:Uncharacterized protein n=1 Tax=Schistosoma mattheei TaxID=31246 RepID=A0A183PPR5_9TREM|nr:unnamed protein product [Schistosoma mattheei]
MPVGTSGNQCISIGDINPSSPTVILETHTQIPSSNVKGLQNTVKIKMSIPCEKKVYTEPSGSRPNTKNIAVTLSHKNILLDNMFYLNNLGGGYMDTFRSNIAQDGHYNRRVSSDKIRQTSEN